MRDILKHWHGDMSRLVLLEDGKLFFKMHSSPIIFVYYLGSSCFQGFECEAIEFVDEMRKEGVTISNTVSAINFFFLN
jgi:hypothetical protein